MADDILDNLNTLSHSITHSNVEDPDGPRIFVETHFDRIYEVFVSSIVERIASDMTDEQRLHNAIQCIVWMALAVEARTNHGLRIQLVGVRNPEEKEYQIWKTVRRTSTRDKLHLLFRLTEIEDTELERSFTFFEKLTTLRNRLVHYKENPTEVDPSLGSTATSFRNYIESFGNPKIVDEILQLDIPSVHTEFTALMEVLKNCSRPPQSA